MEKADVRKLLRKKDFLERGEKYQKRMSELIKDKNRKLMRCKVKVEEMFEEHNK